MEFSDNSNEPELDGVVSVGLHDATWVLESRRSCGLIHLPGGFHQHRSDQPSESGWPSNSHGLCYPWILMWSWTLILWLSPSL